MQVNINRAIKSIKEDINFYQPLYEGIVNSFQANANKIEIKFNIKDNYVIGYTIEDNGEGFTNDNIKSYLELWSEHKIEKGALGSGRILCLKVFDNILIKSQTLNSFDKKAHKELAHYIEMDFNKNFKANTIEDIKIVEAISDKSFTITEFKNINDEYVSLYEKSKEPFDLEKIKENIFIKLLPMFIRFNREDKDFSININSLEWLNRNNLQTEFREHKFEEESFVISKDLAIYNKENEDLKDEQKFEFTLLYRITEDKNKQLEQFYGASDRYIKAFPKGIKLEKLDEGYSGIFCLTSIYFDTRVEDSRNAFTITFNQSNATKENPITFPEINNELKKLLNKVLLNKFPETKKEFTNRQELAVEKFPHLSRYIKKIDSLTMSESDMLKQAEKEFIAETKLVRQEVQNFTEKIKQDKNFDEKAYQEVTRHFTQVGREQLADYIGYRQTIIDMLLEIHDETTKDGKRFNESDIHNLFMPQYQTSDTSFHYANNVWIFDDKFMSYNYSASDKTIAKIVSDVTGKSKEEILKFQREKKSDLVMLYSNPEDEYKDVLIIEFKRLNDGIDGKEKALTQLKKYPLFIRENIENVRSIFAYSIIDIDEEFERTLTKIEGFHKNSFGDKENKVSAYYRYNEEVQAHINVVSFLQVLEDASKRNKVFLDILIQNFKLK